MSSDTLCPLPWSGLHYGCDGYIYPCCYINQKNIYSYRLGRVEEGAEKSYNSPILKDMRLKMLSGIKIDACSSCYKREKLNFESFRQWKTKQYPDILSIPTSSDGYVPFEGFKYFEFKISNLCNLRCRICNSGSSTGWNMEEGIIGTEQTCFKDSGDLIKEFQKHIDKVNLIYFFGGEPFLIKQHYDLVNYLVDIGKYDIEIHYSTNLTVYNAKVQDCLNKLKKFKKVVIIGSLDGSGRRFEYLRKNAKWSEVKKNIKIFSKFTEHFYLMPSLCNLNMFSIFDSLREMILNKTVTPEKIILNMVFGPSHLAYTNLGPHLKKQVLNKITTFKEFLLNFINSSTVNTLNTENIINKLDSIYISICKTDTNDIKDFFHKTVSLDIKRKENFLQVFPEFYEDFKNEQFL